MRDPREGVTAEGFIRTGASIHRVHDRYRQVLAKAAAFVQAVEPAASLYVYGSVATGQAKTPSSDIDLLTVALPAEAALTISRQLTAEFAALCRGVEVSAAQPGDLLGERDEAYGNRIFLRHYGVHLGGPDVAPVQDFPGDRRAARGFNGDIAQHAQRWQVALGQDDPAELARRIARKLLLAVAALVSVHDQTWTTARADAAHRWSHIHPDLADDLERLLRWTGPQSTATQPQVTAVLAGTVATVVDQFADQIGLWSAA